MTPGVPSPSTDRIGDIEKEVIRLKAELKRTSRQLSVFQLLFLLVVALAGSGGYYVAKEDMVRIEGLSPVAAKTVESHEFGFHNKANTRVRFDTDDKFGNPRITFLDANKHLKMRLLIWPEGDGGGGLAVYDTNGWRGQFRMDGEGGTLLNMRGDKQKGGIDMKVEIDGSSSIKMFDSSGKAGIGMKVDSSGVPSLTLTDIAGKTLWQAPTPSK